VGAIEIIHIAIPLESYEKKVTELINTLLKIDESLIKDKVNTPPKEAA